MVVIKTMESIDIETGLWDLFLVLKHHLGEKNNTTQLIFQTWKTYWDKFPRELISERAWT